MRVGQVERWFMVQVWDPSQSREIIRFSVFFFFSFLFLIRTIDIYRPLSWWRCVIASWISNQVWNVDVVKATCWDSERASEWRRKGIQVAPNVVKMFIGARRAAVLTVSLTAGRLGFSPHYKHPWDLQREWSDIGQFISSSVEARCN